MTSSAWIAIAGLAFNAITMLLVATWKGGTWSGTERRRVGELEKDLNSHKLETERRFKEAGELTSEAWSYVQGVESRCASRELTDERFAQNRREHDHYDAILNQPRDTNRG